MEQFYRSCEENNLKITPQRIAIYRGLKGAKDHPSADTIYKKVRKTLPNISFDTVYRTLVTFSKIGLIHIVEGYGDSKRFDPNLDTHHHTRCVRCNTIGDFHYPSYDDIKVPREICDGFTIKNVKVVVEGVCERCRMECE